MARKRMVTRTINFTKADVMTVDITTAQVLTQEYRISGTYDTENDLLKVLKKAYETDFTKLVKIEHFENEEILFGMEESKFMELAEVLPPRTIAINDDTEE